MNHFGLSPGDLVWVLNSDEYPPEDQPFDQADWVVGLVLGFEEMSYKDVAGHWLKTGSRWYAVILVEIGQDGQSAPEEIFISEIHAKSDLRMFKQAQGAT